MHSTQSQEELDWNFSLCPAFGRAVQSVRTVQYVQYVAKRCPHALFPTQAKRGCVYGSQGRWSTLELAHSHGGVSCQLFVAEPLLMYFRSMDGWMDGINQHTYIHIEYMRAYMTCHVQVQVHEHDMYIHMLYMCMCMYIYMLCM